ncbi:hypothetical protein LguiA_007536 [Lonicera macranthoides]
MPTGSRNEMSPFLLSSHIGLPSGSGNAATLGTPNYRSEQMKKIRALSNNKSHSRGAKPFVVRSKVQQASDEAVAFLMTSMPPIEDISNGFSPASVTALTFSRRRHGEGGPSRGTRVLYLGNGVAN